ncbi:PREDICTED: protein CASC5 [Pygoscelis adeliae]|uniref:protein CASC5 n=1 Tax=Pygoscelis adeliae TaxID=9238 RepID=UPI0004F4D8AA|nr:PREDICTED: protein CASC5 [Pygoscelis adeliae]
MDKIYADPNMENDNTEHIRGKRLSSVSNLRHFSKENHILKAPRNPLDDLGNGNELTQDINIEKRRKNSRRVSFANTINCRVFQRDLKNNTSERESTECAADTRNDVLLNQNEEPEAVPCEITGMNTLLHAPIQASVQQTEWHDVDNAIQRTNRHDTTLIFSDENEMDMTASHTAVITRNLKNTQTDKTEKIDITSFLAGLNSNNEKAEMSKEFHFFSDPTNHPCPSFEQKEDVATVKKINFNEFLMSLKSNEKALNPIEGPEKENVFFVPSQVSEDVARSSVEFVYSHEPLDTCNVTEVFRGQDDGMEMTKCQASDVKAMFSGICEAPPEQLLCADVTEAFADDGMDMTTSHTAKMSFPFSSVGNQSLNFKKDFPSTELDNSILKKASNQHLIVGQDPQLCTGEKIVNVEDRRDPAVLRTVKQEARTTSAIPGSISSETVFRGDKTVVFSKCDDMEITGNYTDVFYNDSTKEMISSHHKTLEKPVNTNSSLAENRRPAHGDRDIAKSLTPLDNGASVPYKNSAPELPLGSDERIEKVTQDHGTASVDVGFDSCTNSVSTGVSKSRLQHRLANSQLVSLPGEKTVIFSGEDMDLTKTCVVEDDGKNVENESPAGASTSVTCKPHFLDNRSTSPNLNEQEEMEITKCHAVVIDDQSNGITAEAKQMHCKIIPRKNQNRNVSEGANVLDMDKENLEVISIDGNIKRSQAIEMNTKDLEMIMVSKKLGKTNFQASGPSSCAKSACSLQEQEREVPENIVTNTCAFVSLQSQKVVFSKCDDMEITGNYTDVFYNDSTKEMNSSRHKTLEKPVNTNSSLAENRRPAHGDRDIAKSLTPLDNRASQPLGKNLLNASVSCTNDKMGRFSDDENMDITKPHPAAFDVAPINTGQEYENNHNQNNVRSKILQNQTFQFSGSSGVDITSQTAAMECGDLKMNTNKQTVTRLPPNGSFISSNEPVPSGVKGNEQLETILGIKADCQNSDRQEKPHTMKAIHKVLSTHVDSERDFSIGKTVSTEEYFKNPHSVDGLHLRGAEEPLLANTSEPHKGSSQLPSFLEKSVVFPSGENMDLTGNCAVMVPDHNTNPVLSERKMVPGHIVQGENKIMSLKKGVMMTRNGPEQPACNVYSLASGKKMLTMTGLKHLPFAGEKTTIFSEDADMDITRSHTVSADKIILQCKSSNDDISLISGDKTCVFTYNDDMEISRFDTIAVDKSMEKAASQGMLDMAKRTGRKSLKGTTGEKTVLFSLNNENNDMEITESHTAAIGHEMVLQNEVGLHSVSSAHPVKTVTFTSSQADVDTTKSCSADEITVKVVCDDKLNLDKEVGQQALSNNEATVFAMDDMEITKTHNVALEENSLQGRQPDQSVPLTSTIIFTGYQADMEMTESHSVDESIERVLCEDRLNLAKQFLQFTHNEDDMEITASHTIAVNNNLNGFENQEVSHKSTQQPDSRSALLSSCRDEIDSLHTKDLNGEYHTKSKDKPSIPSSASSASAFPSEKGAIKVHSGTPPDSVYSVSLPEETMDVRAPQDLDLPTDNSAPVNGQQDLIQPEKMKSKGVSFKLPSNGPMDCSEESSDLVSRVSLPIQQPDSSTGSPDARSPQRNQVLKGDSSRREDLATDLGLAEASLVPVSNKESKENEGPSAEGEGPPKDFHINSEQTKQLLVSDGPRDQIDPILAPELSGILNVCSKLKNIRRKSAVLSVSETAFSDQLPKSSTQPEDTLRLGKNTVNEPNSLFYTKEQENTCLQSGAAPIDANLGMALKDKYQGINVPLGIFQPKLPNRRNPSVSSIQDIKAKSSDKGEAPVSEVSVNAGETPDNKKSSRQNFSPSQFIAEEFLPVCLEEMDSNESVSSELVENVCNEISKKQISHNEKDQFEETKTCNNTKRALEQHEEDLQSPKKLKRDENLNGEASQDLQVTFGAVSQSQVVHEGEDPPNLSAKSPDCTHASTSSSLDSVKADTELTSKTSRSSQMESQLLTDSICEDNLREKFQNGVITVGEFFTLLQVHVPIQKPRRSHLPASCAASAPPTPEDLIYSQYVYRPKLRIYEEDCQALSQMIDELKLYANVQDQLLVNVNKSLWEVMRTCSDEELKSFGAELNKMKSYFTKESKILAHNEKVTLYSKLLQSAQEQHGKLQSRIEKVDELLKEAESCLVALEADSDWEEWEADCSDEMAEGKTLGEELESLRAQEEELQRELSDLETENEQMLAQMNQLKENEKSCQELLERYDFTEWEITEWSEQRAVFNFLYDSIELTVVFGPPIDGDVFGEDPSRKIVSLNFESLLDEEKAPPSSCLVQRLIFQFIESQGCWQEKCPTLYYLPQVLHDISLVVSRCKILGEEIEFLERWGGKFNLLKTDINDTKVKLLFSASTAFAKFELTLSLSANYPSASLPFTVQNQIGNIGEEEISAVLSNVPIGYHYLRRIVSLIHQNLLQDPR